METSSALSIYLDDNRIERDTCPQLKELRSEVVPEEKKEVFSPSSLSSQLLRRGFPYKSHCSFSQWHPTREEIIRYH